MPLAGEVLRAARETAALHTPDPRHAVAGDGGRVLTVRANPDVRAVGLGEDIEDGPEVEIDPEPAQLARLEEALLRRERLLARRPQGEVVGKDRRAAAEHHDPATLVIGGDEQPPAQRALESREERLELLGALEVPPIQDETGGARVAKEPDVFVAQQRPGQADHQPLADEILEVERHGSPSWSRCASPVPDGT